MRLLKTTTTQLRSIILKQIITLIPSYLMTSQHVMAISTLERVSTGSCGRGSHVLEHLNVEDRLINQSKRTSAATHSMLELLSIVRYTRHFVVRYSYVESRLIGSYQNRLTVRNSTDLRCIVGSYQRHLVVINIVKSQLSNLPVKGRLDSLLRVGCGLSFKQVLLDN